jgi:hypothetical protein
MTANQFEQWKLLAGGSPMSTDVKYKDKQFVEDCVLYTASNYPIEMYIDVPHASETVRARTTQFDFYASTDYIPLTPFVIEAHWNRYKTDDTDSD